jgi:hypothetical protein
MSAGAVPLEHVLARHEQFAPELEGMYTDALKQAVRFWFGTTAANKFRKADCVRALAGVFHDRKRLEEGLRSLPENERQVLAVCKRYGGAVSGALLLSELLTRGLVEKPRDRDVYYARRRDGDLVSNLCNKLLLISRYGGTSRYGFYDGYRLRYPDVAILPGVLDLLEPAGPQPWTPSAPTTAPATASRRAAAEVALDLWTTAQGLGQAETWKTNRGGSLAKSVQNRLHKLFAWPDHDPLLPPDPESLSYELLRGLGAIRVDDSEGHIDLAAVKRHLRSPALVQAWHWVRAWMQASLWQDGIGVVPDRDNYQDPVRIEPRNLRTARELVVWALGRVAQGACDWLDLETFLADLWSAAGEESIDFYWHRYSWQPEFKLSRGKDRITAMAARRRAFWLDDEGTWAANAILGTLGHLGLVERGAVGSGRPCFRLTGLGRAVFGAPELATTPPEYDPKFLTIQPNFEVLAYLDAADPSAVWPLAQMARRASAAGGLVQTFALTRESVYQALESGLSLDEVRQFLLEHSKTGLPANVGQSLVEWGRRREALVLRTDVALAAHPPGQEDSLPGSSKARPVGDRFVILPRTAARAQKEGTVLDHRAFAHPAWRVDEDGRVRVSEGADSVTLARLGQFADPDGKAWRITAASIGRARDRGIPAEQVLGWLHDHLTGALPPVVETAIRNWSRPAEVFLGSLVMLQVRQPQACAMILTSRQFQPLLLGHVAPDWFIVRPEKRAELEQLLAELGFTVGGAYQLAAGPAADAAGDAGPPARPGRRARKSRKA